MFGFGKSAKASNEAVDTINPLVASSRDRLGGINEHDWHTPYMIGYLSMLISLIAKQVTLGKIGDEQLGRTQQDAWARITGRDHDAIGEDICVLSTGRDRSFSAGCENAFYFMKALYGESDPLNAHLHDLIATSELDLLLDGPLFSISETDKNQLHHEDPYGKGGSLAHILWVRFFDDHIQSSH